MRRRVASSRFGLWVAITKQERSVVLAWDEGCVVGWRWFGLGAVAFDACASLENIMYF